MENKKIRNILIVAAAIIVAGGLAFYLRSAKPEPGPGSIVVSEPAVVFLVPSENWIEKMKDIYGEEDFYVVADDAMYYQSQADEFAQSKNLKAIYTEARYVEFLKSDGERVVVDRVESEREGWGVYLFNGRENPVEASAIDTAAKYEEYFGQNRQ